MTHGMMPRPTLQENNRNCGITLMNLAKKYRAMEDFIVCVSTSDKVIDLLRKSRFEAFKTIIKWRNWDGY